MPTLNWIGKEAVVNHHNEVPFRLLKRNNALSVGEAESGNLLVQGDNLEALKALLPYYAGKVKCIYIDPPYNTGNEGWVYNDAVNSPEMRDWLGRVVGKEADDLSRHDKWLCMMYPRLNLLKQFLREDGAMFISIDDNEVHTLRGVMDEIFGAHNFIATIIWQKIFSTKNSARHLSESHDYIVLYAKDAETWRPNLIPREQEQDKRYKNPDNDPRGPWTSGDCSARNFYSEGTYAITCPSGRVISGPPKGMYWRYSRETFERMNSEGRIWWGTTGNNVPRVKRFLSEVKQGIVPDTIWLHKAVGNTQEAKKELLEAVEFDDSKSVFITPKPTRLIERILQIASDADSIVLDSFAGSGTTGHAVTKLNDIDGGTRRFILVELDEQICRQVTYPRLKTVLQSPTPLGSLNLRGMRTCALGQPLFEGNGCICEDVTFRDLAHHVFFIETGEPLPKPCTGKSPLIGSARGTAVYLLYNGILKDKSVQGGNVLTGKLLDQLPPHDGPKVIYGTACRLSPARLKAEGITFRQIPYEVKVR